MKALVLYKGTGSMDRSLEAAGFQVDSLDMDPRCNATWTCNILQWDAWRHMMPGRYDFVWASPPCQQYSIARTTAKTPRNLELADRIVARTLDIIRALAPSAWIMENPQTGLLKTRDVVAGLPYRDVTYCAYSDGIDHKYRKPTRLWGVLPTFAPRPMCSRANPCQFMVDGRHLVSAQRFTAREKGRQPAFSLNQLYSMPKALTDDIAEAARDYLET